MPKAKYDLIFIALVYGNTTDVVELIESAERVNCSSKFIIVNSYYDDESMKQCLNIANKYGCDFLNTGNKGYGSGNNRGIEYALKQYTFDFLVVSNPDTVIQELDYRYLSSLKSNVIGPMIITSTGKNQNPFYVRKKIFPSAEYKFLSSRNKLGYYSIIAINKLIKHAFFAGMKLRKIHEKKVYAVHGSFVIFSYAALKNLGTVFDENIFLFCEEMVLAEEMKYKKIEAIYTDRIKIYHKEDGSMKFLDGSMHDIEVQSNGYVLNKYFS